MKRMVALCVLAVAWAAPTPASAATWCGSGTAATDRVPEMPAGPQVHVIYAVPSDGQDRFADVVNGIADDVSRIDAWWRTQDFTRAPRFDLYPFPGCGGAGGVDVSDVRLPLGSGELTAQEARWKKIVNALFAAPLAFASPYKKYLVYYDGPLETGNVCGEGAGSGTSGPSFAVVYLQHCTQRSDRAAVAAHELLHALGALPAGAPHACPDSTGHPCDDGLDLLTPTLASYRPLEYSALDVNHDDYYAHDGTWFDVQDSAWLRRLNVPPARLSVAFSGGSGTVTSDLPGLSCTAACAVDFDPGTEVTLSLDPSAGTRFVTWSGAGCQGSGTCTVTLDAATAVTAVFGPLNVVVRVRVAGGGVVTGDVACRRGTCTKQVAGGEPIYLKTKPLAGWRFAGWSGACRGKGECSPLTDTNVSVTATFAKLPAKKKTTR